MRRPFTFFILACLGMISSALAESSVIFRDDFEDTNRTIKSWQFGGSLWREEKPLDRPAVFSEGKAGRDLFIERADSNGNTYYKKIFTSEELGRMRGRTVILSARLRGEAISPMNFFWFGAKLQCSFWTSDLKKGASEEFIGNYRPGGYFPSGSFDWTNRKVVMRIPDSVASGELVLGLERTTGKVWYDHVEITTIDGAAPIPEDGWRPTPYTPHPYPRLRGEMIFTKITETDLQHLGENWKANMIRWNIGGWDKAVFPNGLNSSNFNALFQKEIEKADEVIGWARKYGMLVVLDMMGAAQYGVFDTKANQSRLIECWKVLAARYRTNTAVWGYDLVNEPHYDEIADKGATEALGWNDLVEKVAQEVRKVDPVKTIFVEGSVGGLPEGFSQLRPVRVSNVVYSPHMYLPINITHQGIFGQKVGLRYPSEDCDIHALERGLKPVIDFQKKWNVPIFIGEFGCVRWAPDGSATRYLSDCIEIFEKYGWDWCHHCYRDWQGWDPEYPEDQNARKRSDTQTETEKLLRSWYSKNAKPKF